MPAVPRRLWPRGPSTSSTLRASSTPRRLSLGFRLTYLSPPASLARSYETAGPCSARRRARPRAAPWCAGWPGVARATQPSSRRSASATASRPSSATRTGSVAPSSSCARPRGWLAGWSEGCVGWPLTAGRLSRLHPGPSCRPARRNNGPETSELGGKRGGDIRIGRQTLRRHPSWSARAARALARSATAARMPEKLRRPWRETSDPPPSRAMLMS